MPYTIRPMEPGDVPTVVAIERRSFSLPWPALAFLHELKRTQSCYQVLLRPATSEPVSSVRGWPRWLRRILGRLEESRVIGYVGFRFQGSEAHITTIAVHPDWRGKRLGELLLLTAMERAIEGQASVVTLETRASNQVAHNLYRKYGFQLEGTRRNYYRDGEDAWSMAVEVNGAGYQARLDELRRVLEARLRRQQIEVGQDDKDAL